MSAIFLERRRDCRKRTRTRISQQHDDIGIALARPIPTACQPPVQNQSGQVVPSGNRQIHLQLFQRRADAGGDRGQRIRHDASLKPSVPKIKSANASAARHSDQSGRDCKTHRRTQVSAGRTRWRGTVSLC